MASKVTIGVTYQCYGTISIDLPKDINPNQPKEVENYINKNWDKFPRPHGNYIPDSDEPNFDDMTIETV